MAYRDLDPVVEAVVRNYEFSCDWNRAMQYGQEEFYAEFGELWKNSEYKFVLKEAHNLWDSYHPSLGHY